jgi:hypothetical protein
VRKRPKKDDQKKTPTPGTAQETREALEFCFEDVSSLRMVGAAPLNDLMRSVGQRPDARAASPTGSRGGQRWNLLVLSLVVLAMAAVIAVTLLR